MKIVNPNIYTQKIYNLQVTMVISPYTSPHNTLLRGLTSDLMTDEEPQVRINRLVHLQCCCMCCSIVDAPGRLSTLIHASSKPITINVTMTVPPHIPPHYSSSKG